MFSKAKVLHREPRLVDTNSQQTFALPSADVDRETPSLLKPGLDGSRPKPDASKVSMLSSS